jgi:hypothetical protein
MQIVKLLYCVYACFLAISLVQVTLSTQLEEQNWLNIEGKNCIIYYESDIDNWFKENILQIVALADDCVEKALYILNISYSGKIEYYFYSSSAHPTFPCQEAVACGNEGKVWAVFPPPLEMPQNSEEIYRGYLTGIFVHETVHALDYAIGMGALLFFREGLAVYVSYSLNESAYFGYNIDDVVSGIYAADGLIPFNKEIYDWSRYRDYLQAGSFTKFLIKNYGLERFKQFFNQMGSYTIETLFQEFYSKDLETIEGEWITYLKNHDPKMNARGATSLVFRNGMDILIVYGTSNKNSTENELAKEAAENMQRLSETLTYLKYDELIQVQLIPSSAITTSELASKNIVLVGNALTNPLLNEVGQYLPLTVENDDFTFKGERYTGKNDGILISYLNPYNTTKYLIVIAGNSEGETLRISEILLRYFQTFEQIGFHYMIFENQSIIDIGYFESFQLKSSPSSAFSIFIGIGVLVSALVVFVIIYRLKRRTNLPKTDLNRQNDIFTNATYTQKNLA